MTCGDIVGEPLVVHKLTSGKGEYRDRVTELLQTVGLNPYMADRYPHEFSGGQRQRIGIARALAVNPSFIVCDEPVSALDVSIQAQVINLLEDLQEQFGLTYLFIAHDLSVVRHISDRIAVMYLGHIVEIADRIELYENPQHPYTRALLSAIPIPDPIIEAQRERIILTGDVPSPMNPPPGCVFHTRCPIMVDSCMDDTPELREISPGHWVSCFRVEGWDEARA
jgi:oligopeptide transport system ATP-binding protein